MPRYGSTAQWTQAVTWARPPYPVLTPYPDHGSEPAVTLTHDDLPVPHDPATDPVAPRSTDHGAAGLPPGDTLVLEGDQQESAQRAQLPLPAPRSRRGSGGALRRQVVPRPYPQRRELRAGHLLNHRRRVVEDRRHPHRRRAVPGPGWRVFVAVAGALLMVLVSGMALGIVTVTPSGLGLRF
ncbi:MAG: hypothetical protein QG622_1996, partial [Actinomycetota bacterium]|nr:hypothetical protein [Actinomycetota bacterium]